MPSLSSFLPGAEPGRAALDDEGRDAFGAGGAIGDRHDDHRVADTAVRREGLRSVQHPAVAGARGRGPHAGGVAARRRLGQPPGADLLAPRERRRGTSASARSLPNSEDVRGAQAVVRRDRQRNGGIDARQLLDADAVVDRRHARAAVLLGKLNAEQPECGQLRHQLGGEMLLLVPLAHVRPDFGFGELAHAAAQQLLFFGRTEIHSASP